MTGHRNLKRPGAPLSRQDKKTSVVKINLVDCCYSSTTIVHLPNLKSEKIVYLRRTQKHHTRQFSDTVKFYVFSGS